MVVAAVVSSVAVIGGAAASAISSAHAASTQKRAASAADSALTAEQQKSEDAVRPYMDAGATASDKLSELTTKGFNFAPDMATLANTPGYQFNLYQGENAVQNAAAARGLGISGNSLPGAEQFLL